MHLFEEGVLFQGCTFRVNTVRIKPVTVIEMLSFFFVYGCLRIVIDVQGGGDNLSNLLIAH